MTASFSNSFQFNEIEDDGAPGETRTRDPLLRRQTLYQLSYGRTAESDFRAFTGRTDSLLNGSSFCVKDRRSFELGVRAQAL